MFSLIRCSKAYVDAASLGTVRSVEEGQSTYILVVGKCSMYLRRIHNHGLLFGRVSNQSYRLQVLLNSRGSRLEKLRLGKTTLVCIG